MATKTSKSSTTSNAVTEFVGDVLSRRIRLLRLLSQITFFVLINGGIIGLSKIPFPAPISFPAGAPFGTVWGGLDTIQFVLAQGQFPFLAFGVFFITGATVGRLFCGWACPVGFWQDLFAIFPVKKYKVSRPDNHDHQVWGQIFLFSSIAFVAGIVGTAVLQGKTIEPSVFSSIPYESIDVGGTLFVTLYYFFHWNVVAAGQSFASVGNRLGFLIYMKVFVLLIVAFATLKIPRFYCRFICPTGALLAYSSKNSILTVKRNVNKCKDGCSECEKACPMGIFVSEEDPDGMANGLCINCGNCIDACPDAMSFGFRL